MTTIYYIDTPGCPFFQQDLKDAPMGAQLERTEELRGGGLIRRVYTVKARKYADPRRLDATLVIAKFEYAELLQDAQGALQSKMERQRKVNRDLEAQNAVLTARNRELVQELNRVDKQLRAVAALVRDAKL